MLAQELPAAHNTLLSKGWFSAHEQLPDRDWVQGIEHEAHEAGCACRHVLENSPRGSASSAARSCLQAVQPRGSELITDHSQHRQREGHKHDRKGDFVQDLHVRGKRWLGLPQTPENLHTCRNSPTPCPQHAGVLRTAGPRYLHGSCGCMCTCRLHICNCLHELVHGMNGQPCRALICRIWADQALARLESPVHISCCSAMGAHLDNTA